jgi:hypothetical protein
MLLGAHLKRGTCVEKLVTLKLGSLIVVKGLAVACSGLLINIASSIFFYKFSSRCNVGLSGMLCDAVGRAEGFFTTVNLCHLLIFHFVVTSGSCVLFGYMHN